ncbi:RNA polymerase sigma-70 factor [Proteiniphilum saccharofermentans]|uniref:RNA polymerase sigma-70 factor n=1 Tax=Proteiniphilum saccharofermentans TaxID=1642647 RepID=A0A1R3SWJ7_9BACT|nr:MULTISPECIES: RNA polymerase sigma-70 factor [Proteiniphilum]MDY9919384.1 RNA polymerase sigma-70 factor [Proteiniphilum sp.]SCD19911.1 RNA polymerase sigma-70 factor [Proteiniphilum saccharofermentans]SFK40573.1 RNA polymerase sigma-70 factor, ECF subfamily [Porphyromonadaceae bacterium KH3CP3RA]
MESFSDIQSFNLLFNEYHERFIRFAIGYVKDRQTAEDFVSEAFAVFWENRRLLSPDTRPPAYLMTIVKNKCLNYLQHQQVQQRVTEDLRDHSEWLLQTKISTLEACEPDFLFSGEIQKIIDSTLNQLPKKTRRIFLMSRVEGFSYSMIARKMDLSQKSIEYHISKALELLRESLKDFM